jgi:protein-tyrosine phosphatase
MDEKGFSRNINFEAVFNFRDLGGYTAGGGKTIAWRRIFRSAEFARMTGNDIERLRNEIGLKTVIDLRSGMEVSHQQPGLMERAGFKHFNIPLISDGGDSKTDEEHFRKFSNMGQVYLEFLRQDGYIKRIVAALEIIAVEENYPLVFHCAVGKDRTGMIAALLLSLLGVQDPVIIEDYSLSAEPMKILRKIMEHGPLPPAGLGKIPEYFWEASPVSMALFLSSIKNEYGSVQECLKTAGAETALFNNLEKVLLT